MKIGIYIAPSHPVPPEDKVILAPWVLTHELAEGLIDHNHEVFLFAASSSHTRGRLMDFGIVPTVLSTSSLSKEDFQKKIIEDEVSLFTKMIATAVKENIEVLHIQQIKRMYPLVNEAPRSLKFLFTLHDPVTPERFEELKKLHALGNCSFVTISHAQQEKYDFPFLGTVHNGINLSEFPYSESGGDSYLVAGRIVPEKGQEDAILAIKASHSGKLYLSGEVQNEMSRSQQYYTHKLAPLVDGNQVQADIRVNREYIIQKYSQSKALLFPIHWEEPFGLVLIEAMACGTPVVAYARGSVPEIVLDGKTGFIINESEDNRRGDFITTDVGVAGLTRAIDRLSSMGLDEYRQMRKNCRNHIEQNFTSGHMVNGYEKIYEKVSHKS